LTKRSVILCPVTVENWKDVVALDVEETQKDLIGPNVRSLAEAYVRPSCVTFAIKNESEILVGFMMYLTEDFDGKRHIHRFMIDKNWQGKGYGKLALASTVKYLWYTEKYQDDIMIMFLTYNTFAEEFYRRFGFEDTGKIVIDEKLYKLPYQRRADYV